MLLQLQLKEFENKSGKWFLRIKTRHLKLKLFTAYLQIFNIISKLHNFIMIGQRNAIVEN